MPASLWLRSQQGRLLSNPRKPQHQPRSKKRQIVLDVRPVRHGGLAVLFPSYFSFPYNENMDVVIKLIKTLRLITVVLSILVCGVSAQQWQSVGPDGGDARSLAADPNQSGRILLGTSAGQLYESMDAGASWQRIARLGESNDY